MKKIALILFTLVLASYAFAADPSGFWKGGIKLPNGGIPIEVTLEKKADAWSGTISIPPQGIRDMDLINVSINEEQIRFALPNVPGDPKFDGTLNEEEGKILGTFTQAGQSMEFGLKRADPDSKHEAVSIVPEKGTPGEGVIGDWAGLLSIGPAKLQLALHAKTDESGGLIGTLDSVDQGAKGIKLSVIKFEEGKLNFYIANIQGGYEGVLNEDGSAFTGTWTQMQNSAELTLLRLPQE